VTPPTRDIERIVTPELPIFAPPAAVRTRSERWGRRLFWFAVVALVLVVVAPRVVAWSIARGNVVHRTSDVPRLEAGEHRVAIVLGAGLKDKKPSPLLADRIDAAVQLLEDRRVDMLLMSGDNSTVYYDEPSAMRRAAIEQGVPVRRVAVDYAGRRTWDTCQRAKEIFGIDEAVVVTNAFHVDRVIATCQAADIDTTGMSVDDSGHKLSNRAAWRARELAATGRALVDAWWLKPEPAVGGEKINPYKPCELYESLAPSVKREAADDFRQFGCA
jgi:vancomycin permeability regulator SanA